MTRGPVRGAWRRAPIAVVVAVTILAAACGGDRGPAATATPHDPAVATDPVTPVGGAVDDTPKAERVVADGESTDGSDLLVVDETLDLEGVVAAALLIASGGDLEAAIAAGLVGEAEAEAALDALERGSLDEVLAALD